MNRYKIIGSLNLLFGIFSSIFSLFDIFIIIPKLNSVSQEFETKSISTTVYLFPTIILLIGLINLFIAWKLIKNKQKKYFFLGILSLILGISTLGILIGASVLSTLLPLYNLTS